MPDRDDPIVAFIKAAVWNGPIDEAERLWAAHPSLAEQSVHAAAILGDLDAVRSHLASDPASATATAPPYAAPPLVLLCLSKFLRDDPNRSREFVDAARALLDLGADANCGFWSGTLPNEFETALYGAAAITRDTELTQLLLAFGADPNDEETPYHTPEGYDLGTLRLLVESGRLTPESLVIMLIRKHDWHDTNGVAYLLAHGADPNRQSRWGRNALQHALLRDNDLEIIDKLLDAGADATVSSHGMSCIAMAARRGRGDVLRSLARRGVLVDLDGLDGLLAACALADDDAIRSRITTLPGLVAQVLTHGGTLLAEFAGNGNAEGVACLLNLGVPIDALYGGDGYFMIEPRSTALHVAAWRARHEVVRLLIDRGTPIEETDGRDRTALQLAVKACVDSYWSDRRSPESVRALLDAGASSAGIAVPCGYDEVDALLIGD